MSKTDKTRPFQVKIREHPHEVHDHRNGVCDLRSPDVRSHGVMRPGKCHITAQGWRAEFGCNCLWHQSDPGRLRRQRRAGKREVRQFA